MRAAASAMLVLFLWTPAAAQAPAALYRFEPLPKTPGELAKRFSPAQIDILELLNRRDRGHLPRVDPPTPGLLVPETWSEDPLADSPFPSTWPAAEALAKAILVDQPMQAFGAYENGKLVRWGAVSTGCSGGMRGAGLRCFLSSTLASRPEHSRPPPYTPILLEAVPPLDVRRPPSGGAIPDSSGRATTAASGRRSSVRGRSRRRFAQSHPVPAV